MLTRLMPQYCCVCELARSLSCRLVPPEMSPEQKPGRLPWHLSALQPCDIVILANPLWPDSLSPRSVFLPASPPPWQIFNLTAASANHSDFIFFIFIFLLACNLKEKANKALAPLLRFGSGAALFFLNIHKVHITAK